MSLHFPFNECFLSDNLLANVRLYEDAAEVLMTYFRGTFGKRIGTSVIIADGKSQTLYFIVLCSSLKRHVKSVVIGQNG